MTDPYKVLGVSPTASDEEIKQAYRKLAKQYHPDNYVNNPLADLAAQKMKEINEAYDTIMRQRANASNGYSGYSGSNTGYSGGGSGSDAYTGSVYLRIRQLIATRRAAEAEILLLRIPENQRNAEWHFLMGHVLYQKGWLFDARNEMETACRLDPYNAEYRAGLDSLNTGSAYSPYSGRQAQSCSGCDICAGLCIADTCCECMGGDLISCC